MHRHEDQLGSRQEFLQFLGCIDPVELWHRDIERDDVRVKVLGHSKQRTAIFRHTDDLALILQQFPEPIQHQRMVITQKDPGSAHDTPSGTSTTTCTFVPFPTAETTCKSP